jgi:hypothetical protein
MKTNKFYKLKDIQGNTTDFNRKKGIHCKSGVYFWGFTLNREANLPKSKEELVIYYIGKSENNLSECIMQEVTQLLFGGFGTIIDHNWLIENPTKARIFDKRENFSDTDVLYRPHGLHVLYDFLIDKNIQNTLEWMRERLILTWIDDIAPSDLNLVEGEFHHIVRTNTLGIGKIKKLKPKKDVQNKIQTPFFHSIDWSKNETLRDWFIDVNKNI